MKICINAVQNRNALKEIKPTKIAVAFVGTGWKKYVSPKNLKEIVLSPTFGSYPKAIEEIMDMIGESNVYFLDNLHSKIYLGNESALLGSFNLSDNGFSNSGLLEAGVILSAPASIEKLRSVFDAYKTKAAHLYPTPKSKKDKLRELVKQWQSSIWYGLNTEQESEKSPSITNYRSDQDQIHIAWYQPCDLNYNEEAICSVVPNAKGISPDEYFTDVLMFHEKDRIQPGDWILCWHCRDDGYPRKNCEIYWFHVHHVVPNGIYDDNYTKLVGQAENLKCPPPPFSLVDPHTKSLIRDALSSNKFPELLALDDEIWRLTRADKMVPKFLEHLRKKARQGKR